LAQARLKQAAATAAMAGVVPLDGAAADPAPLAAARDDEGLIPHGDAAARRSVAVAPRVISERFDPHLLRWLHQNGLDFADPLPAEAARQLRRLRWPMAALLLLSLTAFGLQAWCTIAGLLILVRGNLPKSCYLMRIWLISYVITASLMHSCVGWAVPLLLGLVVAGPLVRSGGAASCALKAPELSAFVDEVGAFTVVALTCLAASAVAIFVIDRRVRQLHRRWGVEGPAIEDVVRSIVASAPPEVSADQECAICMGDGGLLEGWRELPCNHQFHQECLLEWLQRSRRCPLCRLDLHPAYLEG